MSEFDGLVARLKMFSKASIDERVMLQGRDLYRAADAITELEARATRAEARVAEAVEVVRNVLEWDGRRNYPIPYAVRDPMHKLLWSINADNSGQQNVTQEQEVDTVPVLGTGHLPPVENAAVAEHLSDVQPNAEPQVNPMLPEGA
jgi:hypothetical protein